MAVVRKLLVLLIACIHLICTQEAITKSLAEYNEHINSLKADMNEATKSADQIRQQIQDFRKK